MMHRREADASPSFSTSRLFRSGPLRLFGILLCALALIALLAGACLGGGRGDQITFVSERDGNPEIYVMDSKDSDRDGNGDEIVRLTANSVFDGEPRWDPDRKWIAYVSDESGDREIHKIDPNEEDPANSKVTNIQGPDSNFLWAPDGERIAFVSQRDGTNDILLIDAEGDKGTLNTVYSTGETVPTLTGWSSDGGFVVFNLGDASESGPGIFARNPDGVDIRRLTEAEDRNAQWSPEDEVILFISIRDGNEEIYTMSDTGENERPLTSFDARDYQPSWSPSGDQIVFVSERDGDAEIFVMDSDGSDQRQLTQNEATDNQPVWSPDGKRIAFVSDAPGNAEIIVMKADGTEQTRLTNNPADDYAPNW